MAYFQALSSYLPAGSEGLYKTYKQPISGPDFNLGPVEYKARMLVTRKGSSMLCSGEFLHHTFK